MSVYVMALTFTHHLICLHCQLHLIIPKLFAFTV